MFSFSLSIVGNLYRPRSAKILRDKLGYGGIVYDTNYSDWWSHRKAILSEPFDNHVILSDNLEPCADFLLAVEQVVSIFPNDVLSFCTTEFPSGPLLANSQKRHFYVTQGTPIRAISFPKQFLITWIKWCDRNIQPSVQFTDTRLYAYLHYINSHVLCASPDLCYVPTTSEILPANFIGLSKDPLSINWTENLKRLPTEPEVVFNYDAWLHNLNLKVQDNFLV